MRRWAHRRWLGLRRALHHGAVGVRQALRHVWMEREMALPTSIARKRRETAWDDQGFKLLVVLCIMCHVVFFSVAFARMTVKIDPAASVAVRKVHAATISSLGGQGGEQASEYSLSNRIKEASGNMVHQIFHHHWFGFFVHYDHREQDRKKGLATPLAEELGQVESFPDQAQEDGSDVVTASNDLWYVGVLLALIGTMLTALGNHLVTLSHRLAKRENEELQRQASSEKRLRLRLVVFVHALEPSSKRGLIARRLIKTEFTRPSLLLWLVGNVAITILGTVLTLTSLAFASQSLLAPLSGLTIVWNALLATTSWFGSAVLSRRAIRATILTLFGCVSIVIAGPRGTRHFDLEQLLGMFGRLLFQLFTLFNMVLVSALWKVSKDDSRSVARRRLAHGILPGIMGGFSNVFAKAAVELMGSGALFSSFSSIVILAFTVAAAGLQLAWINSGLALYDPLYIVPVYQASLLICSTLCGALYYGDFDELSFSQYLAFVFGVTVIVTGVMMLATSASGSRPKSKGRSATAAAAHNKKFTPASKKAHQALDKRFAPPSPSGPDLNWSSGKAVTIRSTPPRERKKSGAAL